MKNGILDLLVIECDDWALLFDGQKLVLQQRGISHQDLADYAGEQPFTLKAVSGYGSSLEEAMFEDGEVDPSWPRAKCLAMIE